MLMQTSTLEISRHSPRLKGSLAGLMRYWQGLPCQDNLPIPMRKSFHPADITDILPRISLMKRLSDRHIMVGLVGTEIDALWKRPITGMNLFDLAPPEMHQNLERFYTAIINHPVGAVVSERKIGTNRIPFDVSTLYLPMADREGVSNYIIGCSIYKTRFKGIGLKDRLLIDQRNVRKVAFLDLGFGVPEIKFATVESPAPYQAQKTKVPSGWLAKLFMSHEGPLKLN